MTAKRGNTPDSACSGKAAYATAAKAWAVLKRRMASRRIVANKERGNVRVYRCDYCHQHHIGSTMR